MTFALNAEKVLELAKEYKTVILEDNPYGMLRFEDKSVPTIKDSMQR